MNENSPQPTRAVKDWIHDAILQLVGAGIPSARLDAELILAHTLRVSRTTLHAHPDAPLSDRHQEIAAARLSLRLDRVPVAYIIGHKEFYGRSFHVTSATLIPRPESEDLIDLLKEAYPKSASLISNDPLTLVDVGTGSGALGLTAKCEYGDLLDVTLTDVSRHALAIAEKNARQLQADVTLLHGDLLAAVPFACDIIVANLPYVDPEWARSPETDHEPAEALFARRGGLALIEELITQTREKLKTGGSLILEADPVQHAEITKKAQESGLVLEQTKGYGLLYKKLK